MNYAKPGNQNNHCAALDGVCTATTTLKGQEGNRRFGLISFSRQIGVDPGRSRLDCSVSHSKALISEFRAFKNHKEQRTGYPTHSWLQSGPARTNRILLTVGKPQIFGRSISEAWQREDGSWGEFRTTCTLLIYSSAPSKLRHQPIHSRSIMHVFLRKYRDSPNPHPADAYLHINRTTRGIVAVHKGGLAIAAYLPEIESKVRVSLPEILEVTLSSFQHMDTYPFRIGDATVCTEHC